MVCHMSERADVTWNISRTFERKALEAALARYKATKVRPKTKHQILMWKVNGLTITLYEKSLVVQGRLNDIMKRLLREIAAIKGLALDQKNASKLTNILPRKQNATVCPECGQSSFMIEGYISGLEVLFKRECGHIDKIQPPLTMLNSRILPDISILVAKAISKLAQLGYFRGFEILIPDFIMNAVDFFGKGKKEAVSSEIDALRNMEKKEGMFTIINYQNGIQVSLNRHQFQVEEDNKVLQIAHLTNSILATCDKNLRDKAVLSNRPVIYIPAEILGKIKMISETRNP